MDVLKEILEANLKQFKEDVHKELLKEIRGRNSLTIPGEFIKEKLIEQYQKEFREVFMKKSS